MKTISTYHPLWALMLAISLISCGGSGQMPFPEKADMFAIELENHFKTVIDAQANIGPLTDRVAADSLHRIKNQTHRALTAEFPLCYDWWLQDGQEVDWFKDTFDNQLALRVASVAGHLGVDASSFKTVEQYIELCKERRAKRLATFVKDKPKIVFTKYHTLRPSFFAYTEGQSDARGERNFYPGSQLSMITMNGIWAKEDVLIKDSIGRFRDPDVDFDGKRVLFSWKKSDREDDFHLYEMDMKTLRVRQITHGKGYADIEPIYLPNGNIMFNSTRVGTSVDCFYTEVSNLYLCDSEGKYMRQIGFDQVHTVTPALLDDGRVVYTRWDYNDRAQVFTQPLFQMNPDGTAQSEYYGVNSWFPTTVAHVRQIPGTRKVMATFMGHHSTQHGKLGIIDPEAGRDENEGVMFVAPLRKPANERIDSYGQFTDQFQYPCPLNEKEFLISYTPIGYHQTRLISWKNYYEEWRLNGLPMMFGIYWMDIDGNRELLISDPEISCNQPRMLVARPTPFKRASIVDYSKTTGIYYMQNIYEGQLMDSLPKGSIKKLRIIELEFRTAGVGSNDNSGPGGGGICSSPVGAGNTSWDVKVVRGEVDVYEDGSAFFEVPARVPLYFQALDSCGNMVQTMRSWSTLQPGEMQSCVGCHEHKNSVPVSLHPVSIAMDKGVQQIVPIDDNGVRGFSFIKEVQPILDKHCISCHDGKRNKLNLTGEQIVHKPSRRNFSFAYLNLTHAVPSGSTAENIARIRAVNLKANPDHPEVNWISNMSEPTMIKPYTAGAAKSNIIKRLKEGHGKTNLTPQEISTIALWIDLVTPYVGDYFEANNWSEKELEFYRYHDAKRQKAREEDNEAIREYIVSLNK